MYTRILVPVSFEGGRDAQGAMEIAKALRAPGGQITCLHVMEHLPTYATEFVPVDHMTKAREEVSTGLSALIEDVEDAATVVVDGQAARKILDFADDNDCDLILIASHQPGMSDYLLGSTAARVVRHAGCSVHVLR